MRSQSELATLERDFLTIGVDESPPLPFQIGKPDSADFTGFEVDLIKAITDRLALGVRYKSALWSEIIRALTQGHLDMICTAATITEDRRRIVDFSEPYFDTELAVMVRQESITRTLADLDGKVIGVRTSTTAEEFSRREIVGASFRTYHLNSEAYIALQTRQVDAVVDDSHILKSFERIIPEVKMAMKIAGTNCHYGMVFAKGADCLRKLVNQALGQIRADGTYARLYTRWFVSHGWKV